MDGINKFPRHCFFFCFFFCRMTAQERWSSTRSSMRCPDVWLVSLNHFKYLGLISCLGPRSSSPSWRTPQLLASHPIRSGASGWIWLKKHRKCNSFPHGSISPTPNNHTYMTGGEGVMDSNTITNTIISSRWGADRGCAHHHHHHHYETLLHSPASHLQVLVQGCQLDKTDLDDFLHHIYQQLRTLENNIAQVLHQHHKQVCPAKSLKMHLQPIHCHRFWIPYYSPDVTLNSVTVDVQPGRFLYVDVFPSCAAVCGTAPELVPAQQFSVRAASQKTCRFHGVRWYGPCQHGTSGHPCSPAAASKFQFR